MIAHLSGKLIEKTPTWSIIDCHGVGYEVFHTPFTAEKLSGSEVQVHIHSHIREDLFQLFGFFELDERDVFRLLIKVSSVGPKLALGILSGLHFADLVQAIQKQDLSRLTTIPGIGKRTAERLAVELKDKMTALRFSTETNLLSLPQTQGREAELESVLVNLGYQKSEISKALENSRSEDWAELPLEALVKNALGFLTSTRSH